VSGRLSAWLTEDQHRARVAFGFILAVSIAGLSAGTVYLATTGPAWRWLVAAGAFAVGTGLVLVLLRFETKQGAHRRCRSGSEWPRASGEFSLIRRPQSFSSAWWRPPTAT
jgi:hypothetical protein